MQQEVAEVKQVLLRQLRTVRKEQCRDRDVSNEIYLHLATELFQDTMGTRQPILRNLRYRQETFPGIFEWLRTFQTSFVHHNGKGTVCAHHHQQMCAFTTIKEASRLRCNSLHTCELRKALESISSTPKRSIDSLCLSSSFYIP